VIESRGTRTKREWRVRNPERSREAERVRAAARRAGYWGEFALGVPPRLCASADSYWKYERSYRRLRQRWLWPLVRSGSWTLSGEELRTAMRAHFDRVEAAEEAALEARFCERRRRCAEARA